MDFFEIDARGNLFLAARLQSTILHSIVPSLSNLHSRYVDDILATVSRVDRTSFDFADDYTHRNDGVTHKRDRDGPCNYTT